MLVNHVHYVQSACTLLVGPSDSRRRDVVGIEILSRTLCGIDRISSLDESLGCIEH